jgi:hypothetical protein
MKIHAPELVFVEINVFFHGTKVQENKRFYSNAAYSPLHLDCIFCDTSFQIQTDQGTMANMWRGGRMMTPCLSQLLKIALDSGASRTSASMITEIPNCRAFQLPSLRSISSLLQFSRGFAADSGAAGPPDGQYISLNNLRDNPGANKTVSLSTQP